MEIIWQERARIDAREILAYIAQDNPFAARGVYEEIQRQVAMLAAFPKIGRSGRAKNTRELIVTKTPYIAAYRIKKNEVQILRILHGSQDWPKQIL